MSPEEIELENLFSRASVFESGIHSKEQLVQERQRDLLQEYMRDRENQYKRRSQLTHKNFRN